MVGDLIFLNLHNYPEGFSLSHHHHHHFQASFVGYFLTTYVRVIDHRFDGVVNREFNHG